MRGRHKPTVAALPGYHLFSVTASGLLYQKIKWPPKRPLLLMLVSGPSIFLTRRTGSRATHISSLSRSKLLRELVMTEPATFIC